MKENVLDVLMYLFESYIDAEEEPEPDRNALRSELEGAGFQDSEIDKALEWLDGLSERQSDPAARHPTDSGVRIFSRWEHSRLDAECRGYVMYLEHSGILTASQRELVIDRLMALDTPDIDVDQIKWVVLMVLFSQPDQEAAYARMEDLVFDGVAGPVH